MNRILALVLICIFSTSHAGLTKTTVHSRANCLNNESITWWLNHAYLWRVVSVHKSPLNVMHHIDTGFYWSSRVAAIHWGEGQVQAPWEVWGYHYWYDFSQNVPFDSTHAIDCNIIDGW